MYAIHLPRGLIPSGPDPVRGFGRLLLPKFSTLEREVNRIIRPEHCGTSRIEMPMKQLHTMQIFAPTLHSYGYGIFTYDSGTGLEIDFKAATDEQVHSRTGLVVHHQAHGRDVGRAERGRGVRACWSGWATSAYKVPAYNRHILFGEGRCLRDEE